MKKLTFLLMFCFVLNIFASESFTKIKLILTDENSNPIAEVTKGTKVDVIKQVGDKSFVKIQGWSYEEEPNLEIFFDIGKTVTLAQIIENKISERKIIQSKTDQYEETWFENSIYGWILTSKLKKNFKSLWKNESSFSSERCGACHSEPRPANYTAVQFPSLINSMKETAGLSDEEESFVVNYYQKNKIYGKK